MTPMQSEESKIPGRNNWHESDIKRLESDERLMAVLTFQALKPADNIRYTDEMLELWLSRSVGASDYRGREFIPGGGGLSLLGFNSAATEIIRRLREGGLPLNGQILEKYPDIRDYVPRSPSN